MDNTSKLAGVDPQTPNGHTSAYAIPWRWITQIFVGSRILYLIIIWSIRALTMGHTVYGGDKGFQQPWGRWLLQAVYKRLDSVAKLRP